MGNVYTLPQKFDHIRDSLDHETKKLKDEGTVIREEKFSLELRKYQLDKLYSQYNEDFNKYQQKQKQFDNKCQSNNYLMEKIENFIKQMQFEEEELKTTCAVAEGNTKLSIPSKSDISDIIDKVTNIFTQSENNVVENDVNVSSDYFIAPGHELASSNQFQYCDHQDVIVCFLVSYTNVNTGNILMYHRFYFNFKTLSTFTQAVVYNKNDLPEWMVSYEDMYDDIVTTVEQVYIVDNIEDQRVITLCCHVSEKIYSKSLNVDNETIFFGLMDGCAPSKMICFKCIMSDS